MLPLTHPVSKTATELRRSINRLKIHKEQNPTDESVTSGCVDLLIQDLEGARQRIPKALRDGDLKT